MSEETEVNSALEKQFEAAVEKVIGLYQGDRLAVSLGPDIEKGRGAIWVVAAKRFPHFEQKIMDLRRKLVDVHTTKEAYSSIVTIVLEEYFSEVEDKIAKQFLSDVLCARIMKTPGEVDESIEAFDEADAMTQELGLNKFEEGKELTATFVIAKALDGSLNLTPQTKK